MPFRGKDTGSFPVKGIVYGIFMVYNFNWKKEKLVNLLLIKGKKSRSYKIVDKVFELLETKVNTFSSNQNNKVNNFYISKTDYLKKGDLCNILFEECIIQLNPLFKFKKLKFGRRVELIPVYLTKKEQIIFALKLLIIQSKKRSEKTLSERICNEIIDVCFNKPGSSKKTKENLKLAYINKRLSII